MSNSRRRIIGLALGVLLFGSSLAVSVAQLRRADHRGWAGVAFVPLPPKSKGKPPNMPFGFSWGQVFLAFPDGPADRAGVRSRDTIAAISGIPTSDWDGLERLDAEPRRGDVVTYHILRNGRAVDIPVRLESAVRSSLFVPSLVVGFLVASVFLFIGSLIFLRRPDDRRVVVFYAMTVIAAIYSSGYTIYGATNESQRGITGQETVGSVPQIAFFTAAVLLFAPLLLHLALIFPKPRAIVIRLPQIFRWMYGPPFILAAGVGYGFAIAVVHKQRVFCWTLVGVAAA